MSPTFVQHEKRRKFLVSSGFGDSDARNELREGSIHNANEPLVRDGTFSMFFGLWEF